MERLRVRIVFKNGELYDVADVDRETPVKADEREGRVVVTGYRPGADSPTELGSYPIDEVSEVLTVNYPSME